MMVDIVENPVAASYEIKIENEPVHGEAAVDPGIGRQNIDVLLDAVDAENAAAQIRLSTETVLAQRTPCRRTSSRRNIDMLLDAVESTEKAEAGLAFPGQNNANVVVEKIVNYLGAFERCHEPYDIDDTLSIACQTTVTTEKRKRKRSSKTGSVTVKRSRKESQKRKKDIGRRTAVVLKTSKIRRKSNSIKREVDDERSCTEIVVPVDPRSLNRYKGAGKAGGRGAGAAARAGGVGGHSSDDSSSDNLLLEVEVPIQFRTAADSKEKGHSQDSLDFALSHSLIRKFKFCPTCGKQVVLNTTNLTFRCNRLLPAAKQPIMGEGTKKRRCQFKQSARVGTWFEKAAMPLQGVLHVTFLWLMMKRPRTRFVVKQLQCSPQTVTDWASYCREVCVFWAETSSEVIGGESRTVELYEPNIVNRKRKGTQIMDGKWVFGGFERESGKHFVASVKERSREELLAVVKKWILPDTTVVSDCWRSLKCQSDAGFRREADDRGYEFVPSEKGKHADQLEKVWREVKCIIPRSGPCDKKLLECLAEFMFKRKFDDSESRTLHFFETVAKLYPG